MRVFGLIGHPLTHSFSGSYFAEKFRREGITDCRYELFDIPFIDRLEPDVLQAQPHLLGFNVTIPYKKQILPFLSDVSHLPAGMEDPACNCVKVTESGLIGFNTDVEGFRESLLPGLRPIHTDALVLGSGGAAAAVRWVLNDLGIRYRTVSRNPDRGKGGLSYDEIDTDVMARHLLIVNTTPLGTYPDTEGCPDLPYACLTPEHYLYDLVYNPPQTRFLSYGAAAGATVRNGYEMLVLQAEASWRIWNDPSIGI